MSRSSLPALGRGALLLCAVFAWAFVSLPARGEDWPVDRPTGGFAVDPADRFLSRSFFNTVFLASEGVSVDWTGDIATCTPGATSSGFKDSVLARINYFRAMAGVPAAVAFRSDFNDAAQEVALMMSAEQAISHTPPTTWDCWSGVAADAAAKSNLSLGNAGWDAVRSQMADNGSNNAAVGHRRWILFPQTQEMGSGDVPGGSGRIAANALWHDDGRHFDLRPAARDDFVAWPPAGFVPYQIIPARWSFSYPGADFSTATLSMTREGNPIAVAKEPLQPPPGANWFIGENTLVWVPEGLDANASNAAWGQPPADTAYHVSVSNVRIGGQARQFEYEVTVIDPAEPASDEIIPVLTGPEQAPALGATNYAFPPVPHAIAYELRSMRLDAYSRIEGAENGLAGLLDGTDAAYPLISTSLSGSGSRSFHLAHTNQAPPPIQTFGFGDRFLVGQGALLRFKSRLSWATAYQVARAQVSLDDGRTWEDIYSQAGTGGQGETAFAPRAPSLADYAGRILMIRFAYEVSTGAYYEWYPQSDDGVGFYVDDIEILGVKRVSSDTLTQLGADSDFDFVPGVPGDHGLQVRALLWDDYPALDWGPVKVVSALAVAPVVAMAPSSSEGYAGQRVDLSIQYGNEGTDPLTGVVIEVSWDPRLHIVSSSLPPDPGPFHRWTLPTLNAGQTGTLGITLELPPGAAHGIRFDVKAFLQTNQGDASDSVALTVNNALLPDTDGDGDPDVSDPDDDDDGFPDAIDPAPLDAGVVPAAGIGIRRQAVVRFYLDADGSYGWSAGDAVSTSFGLATDLPLIGDWNGDGKDEIGIYRPSNRRFYLDLDGSDSWTASDVTSAAFGVAGDLPLAGDWNGDGTDEIGIYRPSNRRFYLDLDASDSWTAGDVTSAAFGVAGDLPLAGDWNGDGADEIGIYRPSNRRFYLDLDGSRSWTAGDLTSAAFGVAGDLPLAGDWNGDGVDEIGIYRPSNRRFYLDLDGSDSWTAGDITSAAFGVAGDLPISGRW